MCVVGVPCLDNTRASRPRHISWVLLFRKTSVMVIAQDRECEDLAIMITYDVFRPLVACGAFQNLLCDASIGSLENAL
jgi:hypothetical protein